jgi:peptide/nickel transport system substrate-binding protein
MDYSRLDPIRRQASAQELDLVESFARGRISRRSFIKRATIIGLSLPTISAVIAACGDAVAPSASGAAPASAAPGASATAAAAGGTIRVAIQRPAGPLDPVGMQDLASYGIVAQSFEFLAALDPATGDIGPGLAESWSPNDDNSVWTFKLRQGVKWHDGTPLTGEDVVETMKRLVAGGNAGIKGVIDENSTTVVDESTIQFELVSANGNFPYLVSVFNAQTVITPAAYATGTTLDAMPAGTGPWILDSYDPSTKAVFSRNPDWWGGSTPLDSAEWIFFAETGPMITAYQGGQIDAIGQFDVITGAALFEDPNFTVNATRTSNHRQIWMRTDTGQFADKRVRQALALTFDREAMVEQLFRGRADVANDHVIAPIYPYFDESVPQRTRDIDAAKALLADAGVSELTADLHCAELQEIPDLAVLMKSQAAEAGITLNVAVESLDTFYGAQWCPAEPADPPCSGASELGIVDYGHRATPDVFLNAALMTNGVWNSSQYANADFDAAFAAFQAAVGVDAQKAACKEIETILNDEVPIGLPYFYQFLSGNANTFQGVYSSALGQMFLSSASKTA